MFSSRCCICFTHMLQEYVANNTALPVLCCSKCFHVASCKCFYLDITYISHVCHKSMFEIFHMFRMYVALKCFILHVFHVARGAQRVMVARHGYQRMRRWRAIGRGAMGAGCVCGTGRTALDQGGQGRLRVRDESSGRVGAVTGRVRKHGGKKIDGWDRLRHCSSGASTAVVY
jgi:hypothetical protein